MIGCDLPLPREVQYLSIIPTAFNIQLPLNKRLSAANIYLLLFITMVDPSSSKEEEAIKTMKLYTHVERS